MNRRGFFRFLGLSMATAVVAPGQVMAAVSRPVFTGNIGAGTTLLSGAAHRGAPLLEMADAAMRAELHRAGYTVHVSSLNRVRWFPQRVGP